MITMIASHPVWGSVIYIFSLGRAHFFTSGCDNANGMKKKKAHQESTSCDERCEWHMQTLLSTVDRRLKQLLRPSDSSRREQLSPANRNMNDLNARKKNGNSTMSRFTSSRERFVHKLLKKLFFLLKFKVQKTAARKPEFPSSAPGVGASETKDKSRSGRINNLHKLHLKMIQFTVCWCFHFPLAPALYPSSAKGIKELLITSRTMDGEKAIGNARNYGPRMTEPRAQPLNSDKSMASELARASIARSRKSNFLTRTRSKLVLTSFRMHSSTITQFTTRHTHQPNL